MIIFFFRLCGVRFGFLERNFPLRRRFGPKQLLSRLVVGGRAPLLLSEETGIPEAPQILTGLKRLHSVILAVRLRTIPPRTSGYERSNSLMQTASSDMEAEIDNYGRIVIPKKRFEVRSVLSRALLLRFA
ncbi:hypothetical protein BSZ35_18400 [Salinibacter sp. 10B]|nr:hypothetical protein BSZ35_18400 [Salinibacter sp. 10B]